MEQRRTRARNKESVIYQQVIYTLSLTYGVVILLHTRERDVAAAGVVDSLLLHSAQSLYLPHMSRLRTL